VAAQVNLNDNFYGCRYGSCPLSNGEKNAWGGMMGRNMLGWGGMPFYGWFGWIIAVVFWTLIILAIVYLVRYLFWGSYDDKRMWTEERAKNKTKKEDSAITILRERYAKGEIEKKEYEEKMKELRKS